MKIVSLCLSLVLVSCTTAPGTMSSGSGTAITPAAVDRTRPPKLGPPPSLHLPPIHRRELTNGLKLLIVEHRELPVADFILLVRTGGEGDPTGKAGVATLTAALLAEATTTRNALQIADQAAFLGAQIGTSSAWDASRVALHTPTTQLDSALALFADIALRPSFPVPEIERLRKERLTSLLQVKDQPRTIADRAFASILYGTGHPYGQPLSGTEVSTQAITRADIEQFYRTNYRPNNATLIIVGDVRPDEIERKIATLFGSWQRGPVSRSDWRQPLASLATTIYLIDKPGAPQSSFRIGTVGVPRSTDDYFALLVMNTVLGGSFTSRLNNNLRETKGYTYGARSRFDMRRAAGPFTASAEITAAKSDSALIEFMKELRAIQDTVPAAELAKAKRLRQLELPALFESTGDIASQLIPVVLYDLPGDYYNGYVQQVERVTQADVQRVARRYVDTGKLAVVIVGDRTMLESSLKGLQMGAIEIRDITGQPIRP
ncbi:MAG: M16 family metallopeptidase [Gemmatimonadaceae bacterium]